MLGKWHLSQYPHMNWLACGGLLPGEGDVVSVGVPYHRVPVNLASNPDRTAEFVQSCFSLDKEIAVIHLVGEVNVVG